MTPEPTSTGEGFCPSCRLEDGRHRARCPRLPEWQSNLPSCDVMRGDGSIPQPTCVLPDGHGGPHYA